MSDWGRRAARTWLVAVAAAVAPVVVAVVRAGLGGWYPTGDDGLVALRSVDVFHGPFPFLGTWSSSSLWSGLTVSHPGSMQFLVLALPLQLFGLGWGSVIGTGLTNGVCIVGCAVLARRRCGSLGATVAVGFLATLVWSIGSEVLIDPWSQHAPLLPFTLFLFGVWSALDDDRAGLLTAVVAGAFVLQTHLSYVLLVPGLTALSLAVAVVRWSRSANAHRRRAGRTVTGAVVLTLACWALPLYQQVTGQPGNLSALLDLSRSTKGPPSPPARYAVADVGAVVGLPPWWLPPGFAKPTFADNLGGQVTVATVVGWLAVAGLLSVAGWEGWRRHDRAVLSLVTTAAVGLVLATGSVLLTRSPFGLPASYLRWLWPLSMITWLAVALAAGRWLLASQPVRWAAPHHRTVGTIVAALVVVVGALALPTANASVAQPPWAQDVSRQVVDEALPRLPRQGPLYIGQPLGVSAFYVEPVLLARLARRGTTFMVSPSDRGLVVQFEGQRVLHGHTRPTAEVVVQAGGEPTGPAGLSRIAFHPGLGPTQRRRLVALRSVVVSWARRHPTLPLTPVGRQRMYQLRHTVMGTELKTYQAQADQIVKTSVFAFLAQHGLLVAPDLAARDLQEFLALQQRWSERSVAVYARRLR